MLVENKMNLAMNKTTISGKDWFAEPQLNFEPILDDFPRVYYAYTQTHIHIHSVLHARYPHYTTSKHCQDNNLRNCLICDVIFFLVFLFFNLLKYDSEFKNFICLICETKM
jgi:hypothetical protein